MKKEMICIMCPMGCNMTVTEENGEIQVTGNTCIRGANFAKEEMTCPKRVVTTSVKTSAGVKSCKTTQAIPKSMIFDCMKEIEKLRLKKVKFGQVIIKNILGTGADVVVTADD
ncbi:MAG: DUF1667 domain-containing protein [Clostridia bacterium]|nr:DUF1667 domain-containing protein [Clostridia bacterium]